MVKDQLIAELDLIRDAASEAGEIALRYFRADPEVWMKTGQSPVSEADLAVDHFLKSCLGDARPGYGWLSEESERDAEAGGARRTFVVDPIDGTRAFLNGDDVWCVSVAIVEDGVPIAGVLDCPARRQVFSAIRGGGAFRDGSAISVGVNPDRPHVGGPPSMIRQMPQELRKMIVESRYVPSLAYRIAMVACGELDATFVKPNAHDWDVAAADTILAEAGGIILDAAQKPPYYAGHDPRLGALAAGSGPLVGEMASILSRFDR